MEGQNRLTGPQFAAKFYRVFPRFERPSMRHLAALFVLIATPLQAWTEPASGSADRAGLLDAIRPHAEYLLGAPVQFIVRQLRVDGDKGFAALEPQRPGGQAIMVENTPMVQRGDYDPDHMDGLHLEALYIRSGATWVAVHWAIGATDVWFAESDLCGSYRRVIADFCE